MSNDDFEELTERPTTTRKKEIIEVQDDWSFWKRFGAGIINAAPFFIWIIVIFLMMWSFSGNPDLVGFRNAYLNLVVPASALGVLTLIAGLSALSYFLPYFNAKKIMKTGTVWEKVACMGFWGMIAIAIAIVIASVA